MCTVFFKTNRGMAPGNGRRSPVPADIWSVHRAVAGFSLTALDVTQLGQRQGRVASLLLARGARGWSS